MSPDSRKKSIIKSIAWRILGVIILAAVTYAYTREWITTGLITFLHHGIFLIVFYVHERIWLRIKRPAGMAWRSVAKMFTYETICGNIILGTITYLVTGSWKAMTAITLTYIGIKHIVYVLNEFVWKKKSVVYAYVVADLLHLGHLKALENAKSQGDYLIVGVLTDKAAMEKKPMPIISFRERFKLVEALRCVDKCISQNTYSPLGNVRKLRPDILMESDSHKTMPANDFIRSYGGVVVITPYYKKQSSTRIKDIIRK